MAKPHSIFVFCAAGLSGMKSFRRVSVLFIALIIFYVHAGFAQLPKPGADFHCVGDSGGWTWYGEPKAVYYEGMHQRTYFGWVNQNDGIVRVAMFDHETNETVIHIMNTVYGADDHNHPSIIVRPDGRLLVFYTGHAYDGRINIAISRDPEDISVFSSDMEMQLGDMAICYPNAVFLSDEGPNGRFYLIFRGINNDPCWIHSDDWGLTWSPAVRFFTTVNPPYAWPYVKYVSNGKDEIYMVIEAWHRSASPPVHYMMYKKGVFYQANGRSVGDTANLPVYNYELDTIWDANITGRTLTCWDIALDSSGSPVFVADIFNNASNHVYYYYRWNGAAWFNKRLVNSGNSMGGEAGFAGGLTFDHENTNIVYLSRQYGVLEDSLTFSSISDSTHEIEKWVTRDKGATWDTFPVTCNSEKMNTRPCVPRGHKTGGKFELMWMYGDYTAYSAGGFPDKINFYPYDETTYNEPVGLPLVNLDLAASPNPFNPSAIINYYLPQNTDVSLTLYNPQGKIVRKLMSGMVSAGRHTVQVNAVGLASGIYICELKSNAMAKRLKLVLMR